MQSGTMASASTTAAASYIGSLISLISNYDIRYEGVVYRLNAQDSTIGLQNVRSFGTEGRRKEGTQIPPSDKVYEYILFRGSDIKDLHVISTSSAQPEEHVHHDPAIIQSHYTEATPSSSLLTSVSGNTLAESAIVQSDPAAMSGVFSGSLPSYQYASHVGPTFTSQTNQNPVPSFSSSMYWQGYNGTPITGPGASGQSISFQPQFVGSSSLPVQSPISAPLGVNDSPIMGLTNVPVSLASLACVASNSLHTTFMPPSLVEPHNFAMTSSPSMITTFLPAEPLYTPATKLIKSLVPLPSEDAGTIEAPAITKAVSVSATVNPTSSTPNSASSFVGTTSNVLLPVLPSLVSPDQQAQSRLLPSMPMGYHDQRDTSTVTPNSVTSAVISAPASQEPLLPLPGSVQQFTEEFDFEGMNEKFKKDEVWGYLGKVKQIDSAECAVGEATGQSLEDKGSASQPAYKKDDFFDTISRNTRARGWNGQNRFSERMKQDTETFGSFHHSNQGYEHYGSGRGNRYYGAQNWGRGYGYGRQAGGRTRH